MAVDSSMMLLIKSNMLGDGEPDLGEKLLHAFLTQLLESGSLPARVICMNTGIFLTTQGSSMQDLMERFESAGSEILSCGTCLEYYKRADRLAVGKPTNMRDTVKAMLTFEKVLQPKNNAALIEPDLTEIATALKVERRRPRRPKETSICRLPGYRFCRIMRWVPYLARVTSQLMTSL